MSTPSKRQKLTKDTRNAATIHQTATSAANQPQYDVPFGPTPDEADPNFKNFAASFHKLLEHECDTGLLTDRDLTKPKSGVVNYERLLDGLQITTPNSDFSQMAFNKINLFIDPPPIDSKKPRRVIINPQSSKSLTIKGGDVTAFRFKEKEIHDKSWEIGYEVVYAEKGDMEMLLDELSLRSKYSAAEMIEVYAMALLRDVKFEKYDTSTNSDIQLAIDALNEFGEFFRGPKEKQADGSYKVTRKTLFRGNSPGSLRGDYVSKFFDPLKRPPLFASGCAPGTADLSGAQIFFGEFAQNYEVPKPNSKRAFGVTFKDYVDIQNGIVPDKYHDEDFSGLSIIRDGLTLASAVHTDGLYQEYTWAVDILTAGNYPRTPASVYTRPPADSNGLYALNEGDGPTLGPSDAAGLIGAVAIEAARLAWSVKYLFARRGRPEVFAALIHKRVAENGPADVYGNLDHLLLAEGTKVREVLDRIKIQNGKVKRYSSSTGAKTYLLSQLFPEAAPAHPAWTSGHATIAGACVTVIKAIFDDRAPLRKQKDTPTPPPPAFTDEKGIVTVGGELDKLASNVAHGRNFAGVHYRSDGEHGILLGEELAIRFLQDHLRTYREKFQCDDSPDGTAPCFELTKRNGKRIKITVENVSDITAAAPAAVKAESASKTESAADATPDKYMI